MDASPFADVIRSPLDHSSRRAPETTDLPPTMAPVSRRDSAMSVLRRLASFALATGLWLVAAAPLAAQDTDTDWPQPRGDAAQTATTPVEIANTPGIAWRFQGSFITDNAVQPPVVAAGRAFFVSYDGDILAVDAQTGEGLWRVTAFAPADIGLAATEDAVFAIEMAGESERRNATVIEGPASLVAHDAATGEERWRADLGMNYAFGSPVVSHGTVFLGTGAGDVLALDAESGGERWRSHYENEDSTQPERADVWVSTPAVADGVLAVAVLQDRDRGFFLVTLDAATGEERWRTPLDAWTPSLDILTPSFGPAIRDGVVYVTGNPIGQKRRRSGVTKDQSVVIALDLASGAVRWRTEFDGNPDRALAVAAEHVLVAAASGPFGDESILHALDRESGKERWTIGGGGSTPVVSGDLVYVGTGFDGSDGGLRLAVMAHDVGTGAEIWRVDGIEGRIAIANNAIFVLGTSTLTRLDPAVTPLPGEAPEPELDLNPLLTFADTSMQDEYANYCVEPSPDAVNNQLGRQSPTAQRGLWVVPASGGESLLLVPDRPFRSSPVWSPDGTRIAFLESDGAASSTARLSIADIATGATDSPDTPPLVGGILQTLQWFPDGKRVLVLGADQVPYAVDLTGGATALTDALLGSDQYQPSAALSPDGSRLAYASVGDDQATMEIWILELDGGAPVQLTDVPGRADALSPAWFPDSNSVTFLVLSTESILEGSGVFLASLDGAPPRLIAKGWAPAYPSPDARFVLMPFYVGDGGGVAGVIGDLQQGTMCVAIVESPDTPSWSPDSQALAYVNSSGDPNASGVWTMAPDGTNARRLVEVGNAFSAVWSPDGTRIAYLTGDE